MSEKSQDTNDQLIDYVKNNSWWKEIFDEVDRQQMLKDMEGIVSDHHKAEVVGAMLENIYIDEEMLMNASSHAVFQEAHTILSTLKNGDSYPERLVDLYISRFPRALEQINDAATGLIPSISNAAVRTEAHRLWSTSREDFQYLNFNNLPTNLRVHTPQDRYILRALVELQELDDIFRSYQPYPFASGKYIPTHVIKSNNEESSDHPSSEADFKDRLKYLAYRVYDPLWDRWMAQYENEYVTFPLKWAGSLAITDLMRLYEFHKQGSDVRSAFISFYKKGNRLERLTEAISACPVTRLHGQTFCEIRDSYLEKRFRIASVALLPIIEGIVWEYAWWWHSINGGLLDHPVSHEQYLSRKGFGLLKVDGSRIGGRPNIGQLLRQTRFGEAVSLEVVEYLCEELFEERNPVLHGGAPEYGDHKKASALLFVAEVLERQITKDFKKQFSQTALNSAT